MILNYKYKIHKSDNETQVKIVVESLKTDAKIAENSSNVNNQPITGLSEHSETTCQKLDSISKENIAPDDAKVEKKLKLIFKKSLGKLTKHIRNKL